MNRERYRVCSLFAGAGGIDIAFKQAGCRTVWANENDRDACRTYHLNFPDVPLDCRDLRNVPANSIPDFDILTGGFPCQPFSSVGKEEGFHDKRGNLFFDICRIIDQKRPPVLFLENVASLETHDNGNTFKVIREELENRKYYLKWLVADAQEYGFPQRRNRIYITGFSDRKMFEQYSFPDKTILQKRIWDIIDRTRKAPECCYLEAGSELFEVMKKRIRDDREIYRISDGKYAARDGVLSSRNGIAFTLLAGMGNWHDREPVIKDQWGLRKLTPRECFSLQGYPSDFSLQGIPWKSAYRQAGNTVCVPVVRLFAEKVVEAMDAAKRAASIRKIDVLAGTVRNQHQLETALRYSFYHFPKQYMPVQMKDITWAGLYIPPWMDINGYGIRYLGRIKSCIVMPRKEIRELPRNSEAEYCRIEVEKWHRLDSLQGIKPNGPVSVISIVPPADIK